mmetsp:Transcript_4326/g.4907  ORF Transcript_4326/g.4907 Transcript_4326/m.4907 type:complete len:84 (+) Transcript_4326:2334-2585(+)
MVFFSSLSSNESIMLCVVFSVAVAVALAVAVTVAVEGVVSMISVSVLEVSAETPVQVAVKDERKLFMNAHKCIYLGVYSSRNG